MIAANTVTFELLKTLQGNDIGIKTHQIDNGSTIISEMKITTRAGLVHTKYLHVRINHANGRVEYYREQKDGNFKGGFVK